MNDAFTGDYEMDGAEDFRMDYLNYLEVKSQEISEQQEARRYYHGSQWTAEQIKVFNKRKQPVVTFNRIGRKINAVVGLLERQKQDPRAYPRTPEHEEGAELATAVIRYAMDAQDWPVISSEAGLHGGVDGLAGVEMNLEPGDAGDVEIGLDNVDPSSFFYDPRSLKPDFSDARYMGVGKWSDVEAAVEMFPDSEEQIRSSLDAGSDLTSSPDTDDKWMMGSGKRRKIRIVDYWYKKGGVWRWCIFTGSVKLAEGKSPFADEKGRSICKYIMYSGNVDHEGDRYGFVRNMRSSQDEINQRRSKGLHVLNSRRVTIPEGSGADIQKIRQEAARPDGVITYPQGTQKPEFDDAAKAQELQGQIAFLEDARQEIENYGFNPALMGSGVQDMSGRAIQLQQQAGIAELGPHIIAFRGWKLRVYRAVWNAIRQHWTGERWIRVTDDEKIAQFVGINRLVVDPQSGMPVMSNAIGSLDVDIIIDEGPDTINMQADAYDTLSVMATKGASIPAELLLELSPVTGSIKKKALDILERAKANPAQEQAAMLEIEAKRVEIAEKIAAAEERKANAALRQAQTMKTGAEAGLTQAEIEKTMADAEKTAVETEFLPMEAMSKASPPTPMQGNFRQF